jgi:hypothetical protein
MSTAMPLRPAAPAVRVIRGVVHIDGLTSSDATLVTEINASEDPAAHAERLLVLGAHVHSVTEVASTSVGLDQSVARLTAAVENTVGEAVEDVEGALKALFDGETGELPSTLNRLRAGLEELLAQQSDPDNKKSLAGRLDALLDEAAEEQARALAKALDPHAPDSLIGRLREDLTQTVKDETARLTKHVLDLREFVAADAAASSAAAAVFEKTALKGLRFEDLVFEMVSDHAVPHGDVAEQVGRDYGSAGTKTGDVVVSLNADDVRGGAANIAWEAKTARVSLKRILEELDDAMENRDACVAVAVFGSQAAAPIRMPFGIFGNKAVLVLDKDDPDELCIQIAYAWARGLARGSCTELADQVDLERIEALVDDATRALGDARYVRKGHTMARKGIEEAGRHLESLTRDVQMALADLRTEIAKAE